MAISMVSMMTLAIMPRLSPQATAKSATISELNRLMILVPRWLSIIILATIAVDQVIIEDPVHQDIPAIHITSLRLIWIMMIPIIMNLTHTIVLHLHIEAHLTAMATLLTVILINIMILTNISQVVKLVCHTAIPSRTSSSIRTETKALMHSPITVILTPMPQRVPTHHQANHTTNRPHTAAKALDTAMEIATLTSAMEQLPPLKPTGEEQQQRREQATIGKFEREYGIPIPPREISSVNYQTL